MAIVSDDFNSYTAGQTLDAQTPWDVWGASGTGVMTLDEHDDHSDGSQVVDMSNVGDNYAIYQTALASADHFCEVDCYVDNYNDETPINQVGPIVRGSASTMGSGAFDGYMACLERDNGVFPFTPETFVRIYRIDNDVPTLLASSADIAGQTYDGSESLTSATIRLTITGSTLTAYSNGVELVTATDGTYDSGLNVGVRQHRSVAVIDSQPFFDNFMARDLLIPVARQAGNSAASDVQSLSTNLDTPSAASLLLVGHGAVYEDAETAGAPPSPTGGSLSYTEVDSVISTGTNGNADNPGRATLSRASVGDSPANFAVTVSVQAAGLNAYQSCVCADVVGHSTTNPIAQSATNHDNVTFSDTVPGTVTLGSTPTVGNLVVVLFSVGSSADGVSSNPTMGGQSMTVLHNQASAISHSGMWYRIIDGTESNNVITSTDLGQSVGNYAAIAIEISKATAGATTGSLAQTQADQTLAASGAAEITGTLAETQDDQTGAITGAAEITGPVAETQDDQTLVASGFVGVTGTLGETQDDHTLSAPGIIGLSGSLAETQDDQTLSAVGTASGAGQVTGTLGRTQQDQAATATGWAEATGTLAAGQEDQTLAAEASASGTGELSVTQDDQVLVATGKTGIPPQPVDVRPRRGMLGSSSFPARWRDVRRGRI